MNLIKEVNDAGRIYVNEYIITKQFFYFLITNSEMSYQIETQALKIKI